MKTEHIQKDESLDLINSHVSRLRPVQVAAWLALLLLTFSGAISRAEGPRETKKADSAPPKRSEQAPDKTPWQRIVLVGASATAGFIEVEPFGGTNTMRLRLNRYLDAALLTPHEPVRNLANVLFFLRPELLGHQQIEEALKDKPSLVVGLDFLFWFCYGNGLADSARMQRFDEGLRLLDAVHCPLVLGDIPDASGAAGTMLTEEQIPSRRVISEANRRLREWAASRRQVMIVPLSRFMSDAVSHHAIALHGQTLPGSQTRALLQGDRLHPSPLGCAVLALTVLDAVQSHEPSLQGDKILWNPMKVCRLGFDAPLQSRSNSVNTAVSAAPRETNTVPVREN